MTEEHLVIIGNGPAGNEAALTLREHVPSARITLISADRDSCYRPNGLPDYIAGTKSAIDISVAACPSYSTRDISYRRGQRVVSVDPHERTLILDHREQLSFSGLIITVGGKPRIPAPLLSCRSCLSILKTLQDARDWKQKLDGAVSVLLLGGDLTSLSVARSLLHLGKKVFFVVNDEAFWPLHFNRELYEEVSSRLTKRGVQVLPGHSVISLTRQPDGPIEVQLEEKKLEVDMVGAFFGLVPDIEFLAGNGLTLDRGIMVDEYLNTGFEGIYAAGDCAQIYHPEIRNYWVSIGYENAVVLGRTAALNLAGKKQRAAVLTASLFDMQGVRVNTSWWMEF